MSKLNIEMRTFFVNGIANYNSKISVDAGWCFYDVDEKIYDNEGKLVETPELKQRIFYKKVTSPLIDEKEILRKYIVVEAKDDYEIA